MGGIQTEGVLAALIKPVQGGWWVESRSTSTSRRGAVVPQSPNEIELCSTTVWRRVRNSCEDAVSMRPMTLQTVPTVVIQDSGMR